MCTMSSKKQVLKHEVLLFIGSKLFIFWVSKITGDGDCSYETERRLLLGRKALTNLDSILSRDVTADKGPYSQGYGFASGHAWM